MDGATGVPLSAITGVAKTPNGDKFFYSFAGARIDAATGRIFQEHMFTGRTGRFARATVGMKLLFLYFNLITMLRLSKELCLVTHVSKRSKILQKKETPYNP